MADATDKTTREAATEQASGVSTELDAAPVGAGAISETPSDDTAGSTGIVIDHDPGRYVRTWFWMILVAGFGLFLVFGSVEAHYWVRNTYVERGTNVLDVWRAQVNGLPDVAHQTVLKTVFLVSVFGFIGLAVVALWLASVEVRPELRVRVNDDDGTDEEARRPSQAVG